ncbi:MAG: spore germination protein [bacterium]|jgi:spore germination protein KA
MRFKKPVKATEYARRRERQAAQTAEASASLSPHLAVNLERLRNTFGASTDVVYREFTIGTDPAVPAAIVSIDGLTERRALDIDIMQTLMHLYRFDRNEGKPACSAGIYREIMDRALTIIEVKSTEKWEEALDAILAGDALLLLDGTPKGIICNVRGWDQRGVSEPETEAVIRGPREAFTETMRVNTALIRRRIRDPNLTFEMFQLGRRTKTDVALGYIRGVINPQFVDEMRRRLRRIDVDAVLDSGYLENIIQDSALSPFPQFQHTERPDKAAANLLEGRLVLIVDGSPFVLTAPVVFTQFYQAAEDYYEKAYVGSTLRFLRFTAVFISLMLPSLYVALASFHPEMFPTTLALAVANARAQVPFSVFLEVLIMELAVEILREASTRLPGLIGPTIGIVGAIVLGDAAVRAGIASPLTIVIIAITSIASYTSPSYSSAISLRLLRFVLTGAAALFGLYGVVICLIFIIIHLAAAESLGVPYLAPLAPFYWSDQKDILLRFPIWTMQQRPYFLRPIDKLRMEKTHGKGGDADA